MIITEENRPTWIPHDTTVKAQDLNNIVDTAIDSHQKAVTAETNSTHAVNEVERLEQLIAEGGTVVKIAGEAKDEINFTSDPQTQINANKTAIEAETVARDVALTLKANTDLSNIAPITGSGTLADPYRRGNWEWATGLVGSNYTNGWFIKNTLTDLVEQGGKTAVVATSAGATVTLPIQMADANYFATVSPVNSDPDGTSIRSMTATAIQFNIGVQGIAYRAGTVLWETKGIGA